MIEMGKTYQTRDGREVRIYAVDGCGPSPVHGAVNGMATTPGNGWWASTWQTDGHWYAGGSEVPTDLIEVKPKIIRTYWLVHRKDGTLAFRDKAPDPIREASIGYPNGHPVAITGPHQVEFIEGEGL